MTVLESNLNPVYRFPRWCKTRGCSRRRPRLWYRRAPVPCSWCTGWGYAGLCWGHDWLSSPCWSASPRQPRTAACTPARPRELCRKVAVSRSPGCSDHSVRRKLHSAVAHLELCQIGTVNRSSALLSFDVAKNAISGVYIIGIRPRARTELVSHSAKLIKYSENYKRVVWSCSKNIISLITKLLFQLMDIMNNTVIQE